MSFLFPSAKSAAIPTPAPAPKPPTLTDPLTQNVTLNDPNVVGPAQTILTSGQGTSGGAVGKKTLLGG